MTQQTFTTREAMGILGIRTRQTMSQPKIRDRAKKAAGPTGGLSWTSAALRAIARERGIDIDLEPT